MSTATTVRTAESVLGGERIISADSHVIEPADLWEKNLPPSLKEKYQSFQRAIRPDPTGGWLMGQFAQDTLRGPTIFLMRRRHGPIHVK